MSRGLNGIATIRIAFLPRRTQYPSLSQSLNPATNVASGSDIATSSWLLSDSRARPPWAWDADPPLPPVASQELLGGVLDPLAIFCATLLALLVGPLVFAAQRRRRARSAPGRLLASGPARCGPATLLLARRRRATVQGGPCGRWRMRVTRWVQSRPGDQAVWLGSPVWHLTTWLPEADRDTITETYRSLTISVARLAPPAHRGIRDRPRADSRRAWLSRSTVAGHLADRGRLLEI